MMLLAGRTARAALLLGVLSTSCPGHGEQLAPADERAVRPVASAPIASEAACVRKLPTPASDAQLLALMATCVGHAADLELTRLGVSDTQLVARATDKSGSFTALAWFEQDANELRILASTTTSADNGFPPDTFRKETLNGESVLVEGMRTGCWEGLRHFPEPPREPEVGLGRALQLRPRTPDECPRRIERLWLQRGRSLLNIGSYAIEGEQRVDASTTREFSSKVRFEGGLVRVLDNAVWRSWGPPNPQTMDIDAVSPLVAEASSRFERLYRLDGRALVEVSGRVPMPRLRNATGRHKPLERFEPCGPL